MQNYPVGKELSFGSKFISHSVKLTDRIIQKLVLQILIFYLLGPQRADRFCIMPLTEMLANSTDESAHLCSLSEPSIFSFTIILIVPRNRHTGCLKKHGPF